ncbi:hypothetical protein DL240_04830 [Lujinxingia litoralis]|uniref:Dickkopf N-terminal cysteine-rich domain-containing protein n=1 Tax=Lujinxingia litoralis TaxID=2211119 RepID=A0A328CAH1_9DELT|nr:hypothetical protein [Lujinxingia litoralis]RAL23489.1 hypothetical protein DL240_04830 [Lujinxingia litoralis]
MLRIFLAPRSLAIAFAAALLLTVGCAPQIGSECASDNECPSGARCDLSVKGGICTIRDCRPGECPEDSTCVAFDRHLSFCLKSCQSDEDCREGHRCVDGGQDHEDYCFSAD